MGLDMYLEGHKSKYHSEYGKGLEKVERQKADGFDIKTTIEVLDLGYWRKHPDLHGYIVKNFAEGVDECQKIPLSTIDLKQTIEAVKSDELPKTTGFFFGESQPDRKPETLTILARALEWAEGGDDDECTRYVVYRASW